MSNKFEASASVFSALRGRQDAPEILRPEDGDDVALPVPVAMPLDLLRRTVLEPAVLGPRPFAKTAFELTEEAMAFVETDADIDKALLLFQRALLTYGWSDKSEAAQMDVLAAVQRFAEALEDAPPSEYAESLGLSW